LAKQNELLNPDQFGKQPDNVNVDVNGKVKKLFVEPEISVPVDVLEATTFFQLTSSGILP
jgi:hypothetical protein